MTGIVIRWPKHLRDNCPERGASARCVEGLCSYCLYFNCKTCGAAEGELATHCPGYRLQHEERLATLNGHVNFIDGSWVRCSDLAFLTVDEIKGLDFYVPLENV